MDISRLYNKNGRSSTTIGVTEKLIKVFVDMISLYIWYSASNSTSHMICNFLDFAQHLTQTLVWTNSSSGKTHRVLSWCFLEMPYNQRAVICSLHNTKMSCILVSAVLYQPSRCFMIPRWKFCCFIIWWVLSLLILDCSSRWSFAIHQLTLRWFVLPELWKGCVDISLWIKLW